MCAVHEPLFALKTVTDEASSIARWKLLDYWVGFPIKLNKSLNDLIELHADGKQAHYNMPVFRDSCFLSPRFLGLAMPITQLLSSHTL